MDNQPIKLLAIDPDDQHFTALKSLISQTLPNMVFLNAHNESQAIDLARAEDPDLIVINLDRPEIEGFKLCQTIKADTPLKSVPVIFLSHDPMDKQQQLKALELGVDALLTHPLEAIPLAIHLRSLSRLKAAHIALYTAQTSDDLKDLSLEIIEKVHEGIIVYGLDHRYLVWNPFMEKFTGLKAEEVLGKYPQDLFPFLIEQKMSARIDQALAGNAVAPIEFPFDIPKTGYSGWVQDSNSPLYNTAGEVIGVLGTVKDITAHKHIEETLEESRRFIDNVSNSIGQPVFVKDDQHRLIHVNQAFCDIFDMEYQEIIGKTLAEHVPPDEQEHFLRIDRKVLDSGQTHSGEEMLTVKNKNPLTIFTTKSRVISKEGAKFLVGIIQDITPIKAAAEALRQSTLLLDASQSIAKVGGWELDLDSKQLFWTAETYRIHETSPEEFNPTVDAGVSYFLPESRRIISEALQAAMERGEGYDLELETYTTKGHLINVRTTCKVSLDAGRPQKLTGIFQDITEQKQAEAKVRESELQFRKLSDNAPNLLYQFTRKPDGSYCVPVASKGIKNIFGCLPEDVVDDFSPIAKVIHPDDYTRFIESIEYSAEHLTPFSCEYRVSVPGRETQWLSTESTNEKRPDGSVDWFGITADITERKQIDIQLREYQEQLEQLIAQRTDQLQVSERRFQHLIEGVQEDYFFFTIGPGRHFTYLSPSAELFFGKPLNNLYSKPWFEILQLNPAEQARKQALLATLPQGKDPAPYEIEVSVQGQTRFLEIIEHITVDETGFVMGEEGVMKNITDQKHYEQELKEARVLAEKASEAKSSFLANMSHEIRTPLNAILGFSELMQELTIEPRYQNFLEAINSSGKTLLKIINEILDLSKIESGKMVLNPEPVNLQQIIKEIETLMGLSFQQKGLFFKVEQGAEVPKYLELDPLRLRQILMNLLSNAIKFTSDGQVNLRIGFVPLDTEQGTLRLSVQDTGAGISEENQERIFEAFEQVNDNNNPFSTGTGLGLTISRSLIKMMNGELHISSQSGQGSTFTVVLPEVKLATALKTPLTTSKAIPKTFLPAVILVVDDVPNNLFLMQSILEPFPFELHLAHNGKEACEMAQSVLPNLILMDIKMPIMDGRQALKQLRSQPETQNIPVIALTAFSLKQDLESLIQQGFNDYLPKPVNKSDLLTCLSNYLDVLELGLESDQEPSTSNQATKQTTVTYSAEELKELHRLLSEEWLPRWQEIKDSVVIDELETFANDLLQLAAQYHLDPMKTFSQNLLTQINQFALDQAQEQLSRFPDLVRAILQED